MMDKRLQVMVGWMISELSSKHSVLLNLSHVDQLKEKHHPKVGTFTSRFICLMSEVGNFKSFKLINSCITNSERQLKLNLLGHNGHPQL